MARPLGVRHASLLFLFGGLPVAPVMAQNLVPNPSFEQVTSCPSFASQLDRAAPWVNPNWGTPELYHGCAPLASYVSVPYNTTGGYQLARTGVGYAGIYCWRTDIANMREYAQVQLTTPLQAGTCYRVSFHVNMPNDHPYATDGIGAHLSVGPITGTGGQVLPVAPQITNGPGNLITDTVGWTEVSGTYTAAGGETHLTIGNFNTDAATQTLQIATGLWYTTSAYLLVDDVSVEEVVLSLDLGADTLICDGTALLLDATNVNATYLWSDGSTGPTLTADGPGTYWARATVGACSVSDTIIITGGGPPQMDLPATVAICPGNTFTLDLSNAHGHLLWMDGDTSATRTVREPGLYTVTATNLCGSRTASLEITRDLCPCVPYMPNAFTPNGDGYNDSIGPFFLCGAGELRWSIYDRWGEQLVVEQGQDARWDGTVNGRAVPEGVYVWQVEVPGMARSYAGHFTLFR